jgi:hypothetical protein
MDEKSKGSVGDLVKVLGNIMGQPELGRHVRALSLRHYNIDDAFSKPSTDVEQRGIPNVLE